MQKAPSGNGNLKISGNIISNKPVRGTKRPNEKSVDHQLFFLFQPATTTTTATITAAIFIKHPDTQAQQLSTDSPPLQSASEPNKSSPSLGAAGTVLDRNDIFDPSTRQSSAAPSVAHLASALGSLECSSVGPRARSSPKVPPCLPIENPQRSDAEVPSKEV